MAPLEAALGRITEGTPAVGLVQGEAGVGKTRLVREMGAVAADRGAQVLWGECMPVGADGLPYGALVGALRGVARATAGGEDAEILGPARRELSRLFPVLDDQDGFDPATPRSALRLSELLLGILDRLGRRAPVVLVIEDLHWADAATERVLTFVVRNLRTERVLLVMTWRNDVSRVRDSLRTLHAELLRDGRVTRIDLERLTREETALQVAGIAGPAFDPGLARRMFERTDGNPYFTEELVAAVLAGERPSLPASLRSVLLVRVGGLPPESRQLLALLAVADRPLGYTVLTRASELDEVALASGLTTIVREHIVVEDTETANYAFRHALAREAVASDLLESQRRRAHGCLAAALDATTPHERRSVDDWAELAHHWDGAGDAPRSLRAAASAATAATTAYAFADATRHLERARRLWPEVDPAERPDDLDEGELLRRLADAMRLAGRNDEAITVAETALALPEIASCPRRAARLHLLLSWLIRDIERAIPHADRAYALLSDEPSEERATVLARLSDLHGYGAMPSAARRRALQALEAARAAGARKQEVQGHRDLGIALAYGGDSEGGLAHIRTARDIAFEVSAYQDAAAASANLGMALRMLGRTAEAVETLDEGIEQARQNGLSRSIGVPLQADAAHCEILLGRWAAARSRIAEQWDLVQAEDHRLHMIGCALLLEARSGWNAETHDLKRQAHALLDTNVSPWSFVRACSALAELSLAQADPAAAAEVVKHARDRIFWGEMITWGGLNLLGIRAETALGARARAQGDIAAVRAHRAAAERMADDVHFLAFEEPAGDERAAPETVIHWTLAEAELARSDGPGWPEPWSEAAAGWAALDRPYEQAYACWRAAEALLADGRRVLASAALRTAHDVTAALGAAPLRDAVDALARRARITVGPTGAARGAAGRDGQLSGREREVLSYLAAGRTNRQIAEELYLSPRTVDVHVRHILEKLGAANRVEATAIAHARGLVGGSDAPAVGK